ncbi:S8/S53 family peptidase [Schaalia sp. HMT-877]|nr:S8/S53 family peptidase [Schaalia sp. HMT-877]
MARQSRARVGAVRVGAGFARVVVALGVVVGLCVAGAPGARAVDEITTQGYVGPLGIENEVAAGFTGKGIKIGVIDGPADTSVPELQGANVTVKPMCTFTDSDEGRSHATAMVSILAARGYGVARGAEIINYGIPDADSEEKGSDCDKGHLDDAINAAVADGVRVLSISLGGGDFAKRSREAIGGAIARGVVVVVATGNESAEDPADSLASVNGTVGVGASDSSGNFQSFSNYGKGLAVLAPGDKTVMHLFPSGKLVNAWGTSYATPIVAGFVAVAMQRWPGATGNQVVQSLVKTASKGPTGQPLISPNGLDKTDPTQFPDENPLLDKFPGTEPSAQTVADYRDGVLGTQSVFDTDSSYVYRGVDAQVALAHPDRSALGTSPRYHKKKDQ